MFPVGRLDWDTEGLLVLTNDGELTQLPHPPEPRRGEGVPRRGGGVPTPGALRQLREGVELDDGSTAPAEVRLRAEARRPSAAIELVIHEGRNRQVRRMCEAIGHPVRRLVRTRIGPLADRRLARGSGGRCGRAKCGRCTRRRPSQPAIGEADASVARTNLAP